MLKEYKTQVLRDGKWYPPLSHFGAVIGGIGCCGKGDPVGCDECRNDGIPYPYPLWVEEDEE